MDNLFDYGLRGEGYLQSPDGSRYAISYYIYSHPGRGSLVVKGGQLDSEDPHLFMKLYVRFENEPFILLLTDREYVEVRLQGSSGRIYLLDEPKSVVEQNPKPLAE